MTLDEFLAKYGTKTASLIINWAVSALTLNQGMALDAGLPAELVELARDLESALESHLARK
jgi:hypothetical protein